MLPYVLWNFDNSTINVEEVKLSRVKQFLLCCTFLRQLLHVGVIYSYRCETVLLEG